MSYIAVIWLVIVCASRSIIKHSRHSMDCGGPGRGREERKRERGGEGRMICIRTSTGTGIDYSTVLE